MTQQDAAREWLAHLCAWMNTAPGSTAYNREQAEMNRLFTKYHLGAMRLADLPDFPRHEATRRVRLARMGRG